MTFPKLLSSQHAFDIARALLDGFDKHYRLFRDSAKQAKRLFERADWPGVQALARERIGYYDQRVRETVELLQDEYDAENLGAEVWQQVKLHYIGLLVDHHQPELAETFFNSVTTKILHRSYFQNDFIFVRPAVSTEYIENDEPAAKPTYRAYYPVQGHLRAGLAVRDSLKDTFARVVNNFQFAVDFEDLDRDLACTLRALDEHLQRTEGASLGRIKLRPNFQIQVLSSAFFRNKAAYIVGKLINGFTETPFALPVLHGANGLVIDTLLLGQDDLLLVFSYTRAYFMVDMEIPAAYVQFLRNLMPGKPRSEFYNALGLQKQGKNGFYRDLLHHLRHSSDKFRISPGIKGMVMLVFDLPSFPYVFKLIKDPEHYPPQKDTTRELIKSKYYLVKQHDRVGRMADSLEYSEVAFPKDRFEEELIEELKTFVPSQLEISDRDRDGNIEVIIKHCYIERRMIPLNLWLQDAFEGLRSTDETERAEAQRQLEQGVIGYGDAIKDLIAANIFPGDMLWKNFGVTRHGRVVFYDYDEIEYITDCNFRRVPPPRDEEDEMSGDVWYSVARNDVFPETFGPFLLGNPAVKEVFMKHHADLLDAAYWQAQKERIAAGQLPNVFPYERSRRFKHRYSDLFC